MSYGFNFRSNGDKGRPNNTISPSHSTSTYNNGLTNTTSFLGSRINADLNRLYPVLTGDNVDLVKWVLDQLGRDNSTLQSEMTGHNNISYAQLVKNVIVPLTKLKTGVLMTARQSNNVDACRLLSIPLAPLNGPIDNVTIRLQLEHRNNQFAVQSSTRSFVGAPSIKNTTLDCDLELYTLDFVIDAGEVHYQIDQARVIQALADKITQMDQSWKLTIALKHYEYVAKQPTLAELTLANPRKQLTLNAMQGKHAVMQMLQFENIMQGCVNRNASNINHVCQALLASVPGENKNLVLVIPRHVTSEGLLGDDPYQVTTPLNTTVYGYTSHTSEGVTVVSNTQAAELVSKTTEVTVQQANPVRCDAPDGTNSLLAVTRPFQENAVSLLGVSISGSVIPVIEVDATEVGEYTGGLDRPFRRHIVKRSFFTVGACPVVYKSLAHPTFLSNNMPEYPITAVGLRNPGSSYVMDYEGASVQEVSLAFLHRFANQPNMFEFENCNNRVYQNFNTDSVFTLLQDNLEAVNLFNLSNHSAKCKRAYSNLEFSPRCMPYRLFDDNNALLDTVTYMPRVCMYNSNPMNDIQNEIVGVGSSLATRYPVPPQVGAYFDFLSQCASDVSYLSSAQLYDLKKTFLDLTPQDNTLNAYDFAELMSDICRKNCRHLLFSDPVCQIAMTDMMARFLETPPLVVNPPTDGTFVAGGNREILRQTLHTLQIGQNWLLSMFYTMFPNDNEGNEKNSVFHDLTALDLPWSSMGKDLYFNPTVNQFCMLYNACVSPLIGNTIVQLHDPTANPAINGHPPLDLNQFKRTNWQVGEHSPLSFFVNINGKPLPTTLITVDSNLTRVSMSPPLNNHLVTPLWCQRLKYVKHYTTNNIALGVLLNLHYSMSINYKTVVNFMDQNWYSGWSYLCVRTHHMTGIGCAAMPVQEALFVTGNRWSWNVEDTPVQLHHKQCMEMAVMPARIGSYGAYAPDVFCVDHRGYGLQFVSAENFSESHTTTEYSIVARQNMVDQAIVVLDSFNGYIPESYTGCGGNNMIPTNGRYFNGSDNADLTGDIYFLSDPANGLFSECPTLIRGVNDQTNRLTMLANLFSSASADNTHKLFLESISHNDVVDSIPTGFLVSDVQGLLQRTVDKENTNPFTSQLMMMFADNYIVGKTGEQILRNTDKISVLDLKLCPKILSEGYCPTTVFDHDIQYGLQQRLTKLHGLQMTMTTKGSFASSTMDNTTVARY
uniref:Major capsid protein n=1 Tax=Lake sturgeon herpesvirus TaxID=2922427 RepID=A0A9E9GG94_9VIRU|nr:major capsid protein [Lake sturgeon herpesvirus]